MDKKAHKIALKKRLQKAYKKVLGQETVERPAVHTNSHKKFRPNPKEKPLKMAEKKSLDRQEKRFEIESDVRIRQEKRQASIEKRNTSKKVYQARTRKGQPCLSRQIDSLLERIK